MSRSLSSPDDTMKGAEEKEEKEEEEAEEKEVLP